MSKKQAIQQAEVFVVPRLEHSKHGDYWGVMQELAPKKYLGNLESLFW